MLKNKFFWILLIIVFLAVGGGFYYYTTVTAQEAKAAETPEMQTAIASRGDIVIYASGTGQVVPVSEIGLGFEETGMLIELNVKEGQQVTVGNILARLETEKSEEDIAAIIAEAELAVIKAENALEELYETAVEAKTQALSDIDTYTQDVRDANYTLYNYTMPAAISKLGTEEAVEETQQQLKQAIEAFEPYRYLSEYDHTREEFLKDVNEAQAIYDAAVKRQNYEYVLKVAETNLAKAKLEFEKYQNGPAENELKEAEAELENARVDLNLAEEEKSILDLISPMNGTVLTVDAVVGQEISSEDILTLADLSQLTLEVYVDETDLDKVAVGKTSEIVFDALPDEIFYGEVVLVSPKLESVSNVMAVKTMIVINDENLGPGITLPSGLNAAVDIIYDKTENAVLIPVEALRDLGGGDYAVFVVGEDGKPKLRPVEVGLINVTSVEIISGLDAGETVTTGIVATK